MAINKTINLDINTNSQETQAEFERLRKAIKSSTEEVEALSKEFGENSAEADKARKSLAELTNSYDQMSKVATDLGASFEDVKGEIQPLTGRMGELEDRLYELAAAGDTTSREYRDLLKAVGEYRKVQIQTDLAVDGAATTMTQKLGTALNGAASGFALVQGAAALFGDENEELNEALLKVQSALAIQQGLQGLSEAYKQLGGLTKVASIAQAAFATVTGATTGALKVLRIALASTGIGLLVAGVGLLIANFDKLVSFMQPVIDGLKSIGDAIGLTDFAGKEAASNEKKRAEERNRQLEKERQLRDENFNNEQKAYERLIAIQEAEGKNSTELTKQKIKASIAYQKELIKEGEIALRNTEDIVKRLGALGQTAATQDLLKEKREELANLKNEVLDSENELKLIDIKAKKEGIDRAKDYASKLRDLRRQLQDEQIKNIEDERKREREQLRVAAERRIEDLKREVANSKERTLLIQEIEKGLKNALLKLDLEREEEAAKALKEVKLKTGQETLDALQTQLNKEIELKRAAADKEARIEAEKAALVKRNREFAIESTKQSLEVILSLTELFGQKGEKQARKAFQVQKAAQIASATIDTYRNAVSAYGSQFVPVPDPTSPVRGGIAAGIAVAAGLANIAAIASQKFEGGGGGSVTEPSTAGLEGGTIAPQFNVVGDSGINQLAQLQQQPVQAYVVSGEVTSAQALDRNRVKNATL